MTLFNPKFAALALGVSIGLFGCGGTETQDSGAEDTRATISGRGVDGYLANSVVWLDLKDNNLIDSFEPYAYTDAQGFFGYNPITGVDYCASDSTSLQNFCLQASSSITDAKIKMKGGIDISTGELFEGTLTLTADLIDLQTLLTQLKALGAKPADDDGTWQTQANELLTLVTPLTTLAEQLPEGTDLASFLLALGIAVPGGVDDADLLKVDFFGQLDGSSDYVGELFVTSITLQKLVAAMVLFLDNEASSLELGTEGLPWSSSDAVWQAVVSWLVANPGVDLAEGIDTIVVDAVANFVSQLTSAGVDESNSVIQALQSDDLDEDLAIGAGVMVELIEELFADVSTTNDYIAASLGAEMFLIEIKRFIEENGALYSRPALAGRPTLQSTHWLGTIPTVWVEPIAVKKEIPPVVNVIRVNTTIPTFDLLGVTTLLGDSVRANTVIDIPQINYMLSSSTLADITTDDDSFWPGKGLNLSGVINGNEEAQVRLYFSGDDSQNGDLTMCITYLANDADDTIVGQRYEGSWSALDSSNPNRLTMVAEGYSIQMKIMGEVSGSEVDESVGITPDAESMYGKFRFTLDGDNATWYSDDTSVDTDYGIKSYDSIPADDAACRALLTLDDEA